LLVHEKKRAKEKGKKRKVTLGSRLVSHVSTNNAQRCLTSLIGREAVFPPWYEPCIQDGALFVNTNSTSTRHHFVGFGSARICFQLAYAIAIAWPMASFSCNFPEQQQVHKISINLLINP
jgi:hypothetical protein